MTQFNLISTALTLLLAFSNGTGAQTFQVLTDSPPALIQQTTKSNDQPYVLILPGILGEQIWDRNIRRGVLNSGIARDVEIYDWTGGPLMAGFNIGGDQGKIEYLSKRIIEFKQQNPDRPLYLIGHSGGCRMAVQVLENLPAITFDDSGAVVEKTLLLSPCMEADYDLTLAIRACKSGLIAFRSPMDVPISLPLTTLHGLARGRISMSASIIGFRSLLKLPFKTNDSRQGFTQISYTPDMISAGHPGGHFGWTSPSFVSQYISPLLSETAVGNHSIGLNGPNSRIRCR